MSDFVSLETFGKIQRHFCLSQLCVCVCGSATGFQGTEARDAVKHPTIHRLRPQMSIVPRLKTPLWIAPQSPGTAQPSSAAEQEKAYRTSLRVWKKTDSPPSLLREGGTSRSGRRGGVGTRHNLISAQQQPTDRSTQKPSTTGLQKHMCWALC